VGEGLIGRGKGVIGGGAMERVEGQKGEVGRGRIEKEGEGRGVKRVDGVDVGGG